MTTNVKLVKCIPGILNYIYFKFGCKFNVALNLKYTETKISKTKSFFIK